MSVAQKVTSCLGREKDLEMYQTKEDGGDCQQTVSCLELQVQGSCIQGVWEVTSDRQALGWSQILSGQLSDPCAAVIYRSPDVPGSINLKKIY